MGQGISAGRRERFQALFFDHGGCDLCPVACEMARALECVPPGSASHDGARWKAGGESVSLLRHHIAADIWRRHLVCWKAEGTSPTSLGTIPQPKMCRRTCCSRLPWQFHGPRDRGGPGACPRHHRPDQWRGGQLPAECAERHPARPTSATQGARVQFLPGESV